MERLRLIIVSVLVLLMPIGIIPLYAQEAESGEDVDVSEIIFGHVGDSYEWHITSWKDKSIAIHLPVIVHSRTTGWHVFPASLILTFIPPLTPISRPSPKWSSVPAA